MDQHFGKKKLSLKINSNDFFFCFENFYFEINSFLKTQFDLKNLFIEILTKKKMYLIFFFFGKIHTIFLDKFYF